jgi:aspartate-semialdehyde dehydrogenase
MTQEAIKILDDPTLAVTATCVRVPVFHCHSEAVYIESDSPFDARQVAETLAAAEEITVHHDINDFPSPATIEDLDRVHVGRIRTVPGNPNALWLWLVADNIRIGAALNAIQIAERLSSAVIA